MRVVIMGLATIAAALAADVSSGSAQDSFFNERFCAQPGAGGGGNPGSSAIPDCSFRTWEQCIASTRGLGRWCTTNPWWHGPRPQPKAQGKTRRHDR